ncbi:CHAD domain-containing protein [Dactylosporangium sp. AC04546]|uniref:CYTH and CHAD domain-containing protein n=1 Tax=Dactylosporangium sp. AC04546 TaxID=2862460 RepID=UPI001EDE1B97|nr:CHAD domain-containing protein [Dactylosporangium sp. AC04546]WVK85208.1 CHAD domain-containing protein [Dactylosporangium sp. AC04546]
MLRFVADGDFAVPDLFPAAPATTVRTIYYDTPERWLARSGVSLRYRGGEAWTVRLPAPKSGLEYDYSLPVTGTGVIPPELLDLVTAHRRSAGLAAAVTLRTRRTAYELGFADVVHDDVSVIDGRRVVARFHEIEVAPRQDRPKQLRRLEEALLDAGAAPADDVEPEHLRALGPLEPAPLVRPAPLPPKARAGEVVTEAIRRGVARIAGYDAFARLRETMPNGDTPVHQMRVGTRRLRSDLQTFQALLDPVWTGTLRVELSWLAEALGGARDIEVLRDRLRQTAASDPLAPLDEAAVARIDAALAERHEEALAVLDEALHDPRYVLLLDALVEAAATPRFTALASERAADVLPGIVRRPWRRLVVGGGAAPGAGELTPDLPDDEWHEVRKRAKRARYAADAVSGVVGEDAVLLAKAIARAQGVLGEHQDAAIAAETWLDIAAADPGDHAMAVTAGRLAERERAAVTRSRAAFPAVWAAVIEEKNIAWLR